MSENTPDHVARPKGISPLGLLVAIVLTAVMTFLVAALLTNIFERKQEGKVRFARVVEVDENTTDPAVWAKNWQREHDAYTRTVDPTHTQYGGSEGEIPESRLQLDPWLKRMFAGYAFSIDFRERRGHAYMLYDQMQTKRVNERPQTGACLHCHASIVPTWRRVGLEMQGKTLADAQGFEWDAVFAGFEKVGALSYAAAHAELYRTPDGSGRPVAPPAAEGAPPATTQEALAMAHAGGSAHPVSCVDCHDPQTMSLRVSRPGFVRGIQALAMSDVPVPHLPSVERWRTGTRSVAFDPNTDSTRQEMRSFACAQCHVEYYCGPSTTLFFPWNQGLKVEQIEAYYNSFTFPNGKRFFDWKHAETGAEVLKAQHPEFEMWSQGVHARSGVSCADCHMPYKREGAMKVADHHIRSPLLMLNQSCQPCHSIPETELEARVKVIQDRTYTAMQYAGKAIVDMLDAMKAAKASGASEADMAPILELQRKAQWRLDFVNAENSMGFHAPQEATRILGESADLARQAQIAAERLVRTTAAAPATQPSALAR